MGEVHEAHPEPSSWHWNVAPDAEELKLKLAAPVPLLPGGPTVIVAVGPWVRTVNV